MFYLLFNPKSSRKDILKRVDKIYKKFSKKEDCYKISLIEISGKERNFIRQCKANDTLILCGGDGTLDQFINRIQGEPLKCQLYLYACGSGNDFAREFKKKYVNITNCISNLPKMKVNGKEEFVFVNGVGMGIDAIVCRSKSQYKFSEVGKSYFSIAIAAIKTYRPYSMNIEIDGQLRHYDNVWFFICDNGKYMGGGMKVTPKAVRDDEYLDLCIVHSLSAKKLLMLFPLIFLGWHTLFKKHIEIHRVKKIKVIPDGCNVLQRDGEVLDYVSEVEIER